MDTSYTNHSKRRGIDAVKFPSHPKSQVNSELMQGSPQSHEESQPKISLTEQNSSEPAPAAPKREDSNGDTAERKRSESVPVTNEGSKDYFFWRSNSLTEQAKHLSEEEIQALEIDIFKPLDFYEILFTRMKERNRGEIVTSLSELW